MAKYVLYISLILVLCGRSCISSNPNVIPDKYIVHLKSPEGGRPPTSPNSDGPHMLCETDAHAAHEKWLHAELSKSEFANSKLEHSYDFSAWSGYAGSFDKLLIEKIKTHPAVDFVEPDQVVWALGGDGGYLFDLERLEFYCSGSERRDKGNDVEIQRDAPWGLARLSNKRIHADNLTYKYPKSAGSNVDVYIIDTGIKTNHEEFEGRARWGTTVPRFDQDIDGNGHGTHCAGIIGGKTYGIAKNATLIAVKVLRTNGYGTNSDVIKGVEWIYNQNILSAKRRRSSVANMSLGGGKSLALERAVEIAVESGIHFAVAAGNDNDDACGFSPAGSKGVLTVGASTIDDEMAYFSNVGSCVDVFAPGLDIISAWIGAADATNTISGTSMAAPHAAGVMALHLADVFLSPGELKDVLLKSSLKDALTQIPERTANRLLSIDSLIL